MQFFSVGDIVYLVPKEINKPVTKSVVIYCTKKKGYLASGLSFNLKTRKLTQADMKVYLATDDLRSRY